MMLGRIVRLLTWPFRQGKRLLKAGARDAKGAAKTAGKTGGAAIAKAAAVELLETEYREEPPSGVESLLFLQLPRPRLTERSASELTLEQAKDYAVRSQDFYRYRFPLFANGEFFYEEVEEDYVNAALGLERDSIDRRFLEVTTLFRKTLNANTRRMLVFWAPLVFMAAFLPAIYFALNGKAFPAISGLNAETRMYLLFVTASLGGAAFSFLVFSWPFKFVQQRNLLNLDNYITSKFARINNNFQVAKRRALNVERDKRIPEREELKDEAGAWTLAYHWFAMRLLLCELALRNKFYQVRRNTTLYWLAGIVAMMAVFIALLALLLLAGAGDVILAGYAGAGLLYIFVIGIVLRRTTAMMFRVLESNEWSRFSLMELDATIRDHVSEDKLQIVTFRDRNRME
jgi:hypothetical protein